MSEHISEIMANEVIDLTDFTDEDYMFEHMECAEMLYDSYIYDMAQKGFHTMSLADEMQSLGLRHSMIGTTLTFQMRTSEEMAQITAPIRIATAISKCSLKVNETW